MTGHERLALQKLSRPLITECLQAVLHAREDMGCAYDGDDPVDEAVNVHLAHVITQGFFGRGHHTLDQHAIDIRQMFLTSGPPGQRCRQAWDTGITCLFVFSQQVATRTGRHFGRASPVTWRALTSLGSQAYGLVAILDERTTHRVDVADRLSTDFEQYGLVIRQAGMIMGFHENFERLVNTQHPPETLDGVLEAISRYQKSQSRGDWEHLKTTVERFRWHHPEFSMQLPPEPLA